MVVLSLVVGVAAAGVGLAPSAQSASRWAAAPVATIHPGVMTFSPVGQCTANFVYFNGPEVYIGQAAHCAGTGAANETNGCDSGSLPLGIPVEIEGASRPGTMVYSSWLTMQAAHEQDENTCAFNDFALVRVDPADRAKVNPTIPHWGGPTGVSRTGNPGGALLYSFGNSSLRQGIALLQPKLGISTGTEGDGWTHPAYQILPGIPGDSGSAMIDAQGRASGILSTIAITPLPGSNYFSDAYRTLKYAQAHGFPGLQLALGTKAFNPNQLPIG